MKLRPRRERDMGMIEIRTGSNRRRIDAALSGIAVLVRIAIVIALTSLWWVGSAKAALVEGTQHSDLLIGADDDNPLNPDLQPVGAVNQTFANTDVMDGKGGDDVMIG